MNYIKEFVYDGTFEGLLTCIFYAYPEKEKVIISNQKSYIPNMLNILTFIETEQDKYERVYNSIKTKLNSKVLSNIYISYLSEIEGCENTILQYLKLCYKYNTSINLAKNNDTIMLMDRYIRKVNIEAERFKQFVRFHKIAPLSFYAKIEPDHNVIPLIIDHFAERFSDQNFIIHDIKREIAIIYNKTNSIIIPLEKSKATEIMTINNDNTFENLFKVFYNSITIDERLNLRCRNNFMPKRYHKNLTERG